MRFNKLLIQIPIFFLFGGLATFSLEPYNIYPLIFCFTFAIFGISRANNLRNVFFLSLSFSFGWFCFGLYWIANAFLVKSGFYVFLMPIASALLPFFLYSIPTFSNCSLFKIGMFTLCGMDPFLNSFSDLRSILETLDKFFKCKLI